MSTITANSALQQLLGQLKDVTEIRDIHGNLLGVYTPKGKTAEDIKKLFDLQRAHETLVREGSQARPFHEVITKVEQLAEKRG
jgi:hypothetical protein